MLNQKNFNLKFPQYQNSIQYHLSQSQRFGLLIEKFILSELTERGYDAHLVTDFNASYDILLGGHLPVEVKAARPTNCYTGRAWRKRWQFCLQGGLNYLKQDFLYILVLVDNDGVIYPYIVPSAYIGGRQTISITSHPARYRGWLKDHLDAWHYVDTVIGWRLRYQAAGAGQLSLFGEVTQ